MPAEEPEDGEAEGEQRDEREERGVHQAHGPQVDLAARQVAQYRVRVAQQPQRRAEDSGAVRGRPEEAPVEEAKMRCHMA